MSKYLLPHRCVSCGRFVSVGAPGTSWAQSWSYDMDGCPNLHDPRWQCADCTQKHGALGTNCAHPERYSGTVAFVEAMGPKRGA